MTMTLLVKNKRAWLDYDIKKTFNAGLVLSGAEVKSAKGGKVSLTGAYVSVSAGGAFLINCRIGPYQYASNANYEPARTRKLLLNKNEINQLIGKEKGLTIIPLEIFTAKRGLVKIKIGLAKARKKTDKREYLKQRELEKEIRQST